MHPLVLAKGLISFEGAGFSSQLGAASKSFTTELDSTKNLFPGMFPLVQETHFISKEGKSQQQGL